ncbi:MAG: CHAT domain-containing protein [Desulfobacteraceae bacterium]|nr:CHAT domain-containing protein [Desulfobacteraceae bacterium]
MEYLQIRIDQARKESDETLEQQKLREIVEIIESFKTAELGNFFKDDCMAAKQKKEIRLEDIPQDSAVLYPMLMADKPIILLMRRDRMKLIGSPPELRNIQITIDDFTRILRGDSESDIRSRGQRLYKSLIAPVEPELQGITTLVIVPDGALRLIPFSVLHDGEQYLLEKYSVVTLPAITLTDLSQRPKLKNPDVLLGGLSEARHGFSALPDVEKEFAGIRKIFGTAKTLMNRTYNRKNLEKELIHQAYHYVVMSTHGNFGSSTEDTFVLTYDEKLDSDMLESLLTPLKFGKNPVELLTLSACETGIGDERAALGLGGIAVKAGVRSAMATLWRVEAESTSQLVAEFFRQLAEDGVSKAEALRKAQIRLISDTKYHHPRFWAPFLLIGNWM